MSKKAEEFLKFAIGRGRGLGLPGRSPVVVGRANPPREESTEPVVPANPPPKERTEPVVPANVVAVPEKTVQSKEGSVGVEVSLSANYFQFIRTDNFAISLYRVDFDPDVDHIGLRKFLVREQKNLLGGYIFDGASLIYTTNPLPEDEYKFEVKSKDEKLYKVTIKQAGMAVGQNESMRFQIYNVLLRKAMDDLHMQLVGRNLYDPKAKVQMLNYKLELWPGYITSIRQHEQDILVCCEVSHKVMRQECIYDIMSKCKKESLGNWQANFKKEIIGCVVLTDYNNRTYRVDDVDYNSSPSSSFEMKGNEKSYVDYYQERYNLVIKDPKQPMLVSNPKPKDIRGDRNQILFLVPELCRSTGLTDAMRKNFKLMKDLAVHTQMDPENRVKRLLKFSSSLHKYSQKTFESFNTNIGQELVTFKGRLLPQEKMFFGDNKTSQNTVTVDWTSGMKTSPMFTTVPLKRWVFMYPARAAPQSEAILKLMKEVASGMKYEMGEALKIELPDDRIGTYTSKLEEMIARDPKLIMILVPNNAADRYSAIKRLTCINNAIPTQVIVQKTITPKDGNMNSIKSIATKIIVQVNCKLGGAPWMVKFPAKGTMTIGFDVNHDTKDRSKSYGAFVASMDINLKPEYFSAVSRHSNGEEISSNMDVHMRKAIKAYFTAHGCFPERIFFYRDGVGEGQVESVKVQEVNRLDNVLKEIYGEDKKPKFTFFIVNKRINTRFFLNKTKPLNPSSGTVVDNTITLPDRYDFFLVSQAVRQGTVSPTSYHIIHDTSGLSAGKIQLMTYKLTHLYYNWSGTVRVPAVVQYAHKLAFLVGEFLHQSPSESFENKLYFL